MSPPRQVNDSVAVILCGGLSRRFGSPKEMVPIAGQTLLERVIERVSVRFTHIALAAGSPGEGLSVWPRSLASYPRVFDRIRNAGPAAGIEAGLRYALEMDMRGIWCTPCDAPFVDAGVGVALADSVSPELPARVPLSTGPLGFEPTFGWYACSSLPLISRMLDDGLRSLAEIVGLLPAAMVPLSSEINPETVFYNMNTPADLRRLLSLQRPPDES